MSERSNAWLSLENTLALAWWDYYQWIIGGRKGPEPPLSDWDKKAVEKLTDIEFSFRVFVKASGGGKEWRMFSIWGVTKAQIDAGYRQHGDAHEGGDFECAGLWYWEHPDTQCRRDETYGWHPVQVARFMPPHCGGVLCDAVLLSGQPPRDLN